MTNTRKILPINETTVKKMNSENKNRTDVDLQILRIIGEFKCCSSMSDAFKVIQQNQDAYHTFKRGNLANIYRYKDYYINLGAQHVQKGIADNLQKVAELNLSCAPKIIAYVPFKNNYDSVLIMQVPETEDKQLHTYYSKRKDISANVRLKFMSDFEEMLKHGIYNPAIINSTRNWLVLPSLDSMYIDDWNIIQKVKNDKEKAELRTQLFNMCNLIY